MKRVKELSLT